MRESSRNPLRSGFFWAARRAFARALNIADFFMTNEELLKDIKVKVFGYSTFGFLDHSKWKEFRNTFFSRFGKVEEETYSKELNDFLSTAAMQHTIEEIYKRLEKYLTTK